MASDKRQIRLKEHSLTSEAPWIPSDSYMQITNSSLEQREYKRRVTSDRFLDTGIPTDPHLRNVFALGDSFVESAYVDEDARFIAQAARLVNANLLNGGYSGMTSLQMSLLLMAKIGGLAKPGDVVLFFAPHSDRDAFSSGGYWHGGARYSPILPPEPIETKPEWSENTQAVVSTSIHFCNVLGLQPAIVVTPFNAGDFNSDGWLRKRYRRQRSVWEASVRINEKILDNYRDVSRQTNVPTLDLAKSMNSKSEWFMDQLHLNEEGQNVVSSLLVDFLQSTFEL